MSKLLQYLVNKPSVKHKVLPGLQKMQTKGEVTNVPERISYSDPRYREMYKNRQVGLNYDGAISLPELDEVTVTAPRSYSMKSLKDFTTAGLYGAPETAMKILTIPQAAMTEGIEVLRGRPYNFSNINPNIGYSGSNQRNLSHTLGYANPEGFLENAANVGLSMIDPFLLAGVSRSATKNLTGAGLRGLRNHRLVQNYNPLNLKTKSSIDWTKRWYADPIIIERRGRANPKYNREDEVFSLLDQYEPKNYFDLLKEQGLREYITNSLTTAGISYGKPNQIYVNRSRFIPFNRQRLESARTHETSHLLNDNSLDLNPGETSQLVKPFGFIDESDRIEQLRFLPTNLTKKELKKADYYTEPGEVKARMDQVRFDLDLTPSDKFTSQMYDNVLKKNNFYGMGKYIKDKNSFIDLMNNFWAAPAAGVIIGSQNIEQKKKGGNVSLPKMQIAGQYTAERDATTISNTPILSKMFGAQREVDVNRFSEDAFKQRYDMTPHQYKMKTDSDYAQAFQRQMDERRQNDPNYSEINLPATDIRSKNYKGNPNLALIPKGATGPARAQQEQLFADITSMAAPLLPVKSLVRGLQAGKAISTAPKVIDKLISTPSPVKTAATQPVDNSGLIINDEVYRQWRNARQSANIPESRIVSRLTNTPSGSMSMNAWGTPNWNAAVREPIQNIEPYRAAWEGIERRGPEWITQTVRDWPTSNMSFVDDTRSILGQVTRGIDQKLGRFFSKGTTAPAFDANEVSRLINENLSKGVGVKKENLPLQVKIVPTGYSPDDFRIETLIDNNKVGSIFFQRNMNPYKPKTFSQQFLNKAQSPFERWQSTPGFKKKGDYPFSDYDPLNPVKDPTGKTFTTANDLYSTGISGEFNKAINEAFKAKGLGNVLSGGTGHSLLGEARWQNLVKKGLAEDLGAGYFKLKKQGGPVILPKMQMAGQNNNLPQRISINDPRYAELYKNRQVGSFYDDAYSLPDLDEVTVTGKDERVKEGMLQGSGRFYQGLAGVMGSPQTGLMEVITGKQQTPSQAWGFDTKGKSWYNPKSISNFAMDTVLDPMNLLGVGLIDDVTRGAVRAGARQAARRSGNYLTTRTPLKNAYKYNPLALKDEDVEILQRWDFDNQRNVSLPSGVVPDEYTGRWYGSNWDNENLQKVSTSVPNYMQIRPGSGQIKTAVVHKGSADLPEEMTKPGYRSFYSQPATERILPKDATFTSKRVDVNPFDSVNDALDYDPTEFGNAWRDARNLANEALPKPNWLTGYNSNVNRNVTNEILGNASNYLTTRTPLRNAYKINPWAFKPNSKSYYRGLGRSGVDDALEKGILRPPVNTPYGKDRLYMTETLGETNMYNQDLPTYKGDPFGEADDEWIKILPKDGKRYIAEIPKNKTNFVTENDIFNSGSGYSTIFPKLSDVKLYQQDWLRGYKPVNLPNKKSGGSILDARGQWAHPGKRTIVPTPTGRITMQGVPYPVYGQDETGFGQMMYPGGEYKFPGQMVDEIPMFAKGGQHGGLDRWFAEKWVDVKTSKPCGRQEGEKRAGYPACRPSKRVSSETPKTSSEMSSAEKAKFKRTKTSSERIPYNHKK